MEHNNTEKTKKIIEWIKESTKTSSKDINYSGSECTSISFDPVMGDPENQVLYLTWVDHMDEEVDVVFEEGDFKDAFFNDNGLNLPDGLGGYDIITSALPAPDLSSSEPTMG